MTRWAPRVFRARPLRIGAAGCPHCRFQGLLQALSEFGIGPHFVGVYNRTDMLDIERQIIRRLGQHNPFLLPRIRQPGFKIHVGISIREVDHDEVRPGDLAFHVLNDRLRNEPFICSQTLHVVLLDGFPNHAVDEIQLCIERHNDEALRPDGLDVDRLKSCLGLAGGG
jgi:hypothetical protein